MRKYQSTDQPLQESVFPKRKGFLVHVPNFSKRFLLLWVTSLVGALTILALLPFTALAEPPSPLDPASEGAQGIADLYWSVFWVAMVIFLLVEGLLIYAIIRFRQRDPNVIPPKIHGSTPLEIAWTAAPAIVLVMVFVLMVRNMAVAAEPPTDGLRLIVTGHQWWWEFEYPDLGVVTANELHIPVGQPIVVELHSDNVIHSFWIPRLAGKTDVVPGQTNSMWFQADEAGEYRGQCAELCGAQHANMNFLVFADSEADFDSWVENQQSPAVEPTGAAEIAGQEAFLGGQCIACHTIDGTTAQGRIGPNLTHFGSRQTIGGLVLNNTPEELARWLADPQKIKPRNKMVLSQPLSQDEIDALAQYLSSLK